MSAIDARSSVVGLDSFQRDLHDWRHYFFGFGPRSDYQSSLEFGADGHATIRHSGTAEFSVGAGLQKLFRLPAGTAWQKVSFDFRAKSADQNDLPNNLVLSARRRTTTDYMVFDADKIDAKQYPGAEPHDSKWQTFSADISGLTSRILLFRIMSLAMPGQASREFLIRNFYILRSATESERYHHLPDGHPEKIP